MSDDTVFDLTTLENIRQLCPIAYSRLSKQNKLDLIEYVKNSNETHQQAMLWDLKELCYNEIHHMQQLQKYILDVVAKRYEKMYEMFFEDFSQLLSSTILIKLKPSYTVISWDSENKNWNKKAFVFISENMQMFCYKFTSDQQKLENINKFLFDILGWKQILVKIKYSFNNKFNQYVYIDLFIIQT